jgi:hypothetical protein
VAAAEKLMKPGSHGDVADLTGAHTKRGQIRNLAQNGIRHTVNAAGWPVVMWSAVEGSGRDAATTADSWTSNAMKAAA